MNNSIISEFITLLHNSNEGKILQEQSDLHTDDIQKLVQNLVPKMTEKVQSSNQKLQGLVKIIAENKDNSQSLLSQEPGFDVEKAHTEGNQIISTLFGNKGQTEQLITELSQKTGIDSAQISNLLPILTSMATKVMSGNAETSTTSENYLQQLHGMLDMNKDGSIVDDLIRMGQQLFAKFFSKN